MEKEIEKEIYMKKLIIIEVLTGVLSIIGCLYFYDWKLLLILIVYGFHLNIMNKNYLIKILKEKSK